MSRRIFVDAFYSQFGDFLDQLVILFPGDADLLAYKTMLPLLQKTNPLLAPKEVVNNLSRFETSLRSRNEKFFLEYPFEEYAEGGIDQVIGKVKGLWGGMSDANKTIIWEYVLLLLDLANKCGGGK